MGRKCDLYYIRTTFTGTSHEELKQWQAHSPIIDAYTMESVGKKMLMVL